jgi:hypothetical protein
MEPQTSYRPRVSRETRLLLTAAVAAITVLWLLARIRFDDQPVTSNPVPSVLGQLTGGAKYDTLASEIGDLQSRLSPWLLIADDGIAAFRWRDDLAIVLLPTGPGAEPHPTLDTRALDPGTGLAVVRVPGQAPASVPMHWAPRQPQQPRYVAATDAASGNLSLRPTFVGSFARSGNPVWPGELWNVPAGSALVPGSFLFTTNAEFVGLVVPTGGGLAVVPGGTLLAEADRLLTSRPGPPGRIAVEVQALTEPVATLTGAQAGVVVTSVERDGPAWGRLMVGDVIEVVDGNDLAGLQQWDARVLRLTAGEALALRVRRRGEIREVSIEAAAINVDAAGGALGMSLRRRAGLGAEVTAVQPASVAARAGLLAGDVITLFDDVRAPSPSQITRSFASLRVGARVMIAGTRGDTHFVTALAR